VRACAAIAEREERIRGKGKRHVHTLQAEETAAGGWRAHSKTDGALAHGMSCDGFNARGVVAEKERQPNAGAGDLRGGRISGDHGPRTAF
jgi:hypothetical protein